MARFADTRQHRAHGADPICTEITLDRRITLYGHGINPGHIRLQPGDTATITKRDGKYCVEYVDADGTTYSSTTKDPSWNT